MALLSIAEACRKAGISKPTMYNNYINTGKISVSQDNAGKKGIDPSELIRVFGTLKGDPSPVPAQQPTGSGAEEMIKLLRDQLQKAEAIAAEERFRAIAAESRAAKYHDEMISLQNRLLPSPPEPVPEQKPEPTAVSAVSAAPVPAAAPERPTAKSKPRYEDDDEWLEWTPPARKPTLWGKIKDKIGL